MNMQTFFNLLTVISAILMIIFILAQARGSSLGEAFGGDSSVHRSRRGVELVVYQATILFGVMFVVSILLGLLSA
jgi:preprotein translocase subunit SecG